MIRSTQLANDWVCVCVRATVRLSVCRRYFYCHLVRGNKIRRLAFLSIRRQAKKYAL